MEQQKYSLISRLKQIPWWGYVAGLVSVGVQSLFYYLSNLITNALGTTAISTKTIIDNYIPLIPVFAIVYVYSFIFWVTTPAVVTLAGKQQFKKFAIGQLIAYFVGFVIFTCMPTFMNRADEGILEYAENGHWLLKIIYSVDGGEYAFNLLPSYHCLTSVYCYLGVRKQKGISKWYKIYALTLAILICMATVFIKQHYFLDLVVGVGISILTYIAVNLVCKLKNKANKSEE